jgi:hypothetical protein
MKPYSDQTYGPTTLAYTVGVTAKNRVFDQKISVHRLRPGYHTTIYVTPKLLEVSSDFKSLSLRNRKCKLPHETTEFTLFQEYSQKGCEIECAAKKAATFCQCLPWHYPNNFTSLPTCDMFGGFCFDQIISNEVFYKKCKFDCMEDCQETSLSVWQKTVPFNIEELCNEGTYFDKFFRHNFQRIFAFEHYRVLIQEKHIPNLETSFSNGSLCVNYIRRYISFVSIESPTESVSKSKLDRRTSFIDKLGVIGGTLGICIGTSILSFAEVAVFVYIVLKSLYEDLKIMCEKVKSFLRFTTPDVEKLNEIVIISKNQSCIEQDEFEENDQDLEKLYVIEP